MGKVFWETLVRHDFVHQHLQVCQAIIICYCALITPGAVLGVCMCHPANQETLQDWLSALQETYPPLAKATVVYNIRKTEPLSSSDSNLQLPPHRTSLSSGDKHSNGENVSDAAS